jgi:hypothetical protein
MTTQRPLELAGGHAVPARISSSHDSVLPLLLSRVCSLLRGPGILVTEAPADPALAFDTMWMCDPSPTVGRTALKSRRA